MACCALFSKYFLAALNLIWFIGLIVIGVLMGVFWKKIDLNSYLKLIGYKYVPFLLIVVTIIVMVFAVIFGFCFFCTNSKCLRLTYSNLLVLIFLLQIASVAIFFVFKQRTEVDISSRWSAPNFADIVKGIEKKLVCCGFADTTQEDASRCASNNVTNYDSSCETKIVAQITKYKAYVIVGIVLLILLQIALIVLAFIYACATDEDLGDEGDDFDDSEDEYFTD
ncbi:Tetraspanin family protein [Trichomonas vaginalis G3]|uniref:Tetraspanin family protein n=1 Tax=Trichomonas vaginalis (strain ATCC PRA-98 / G3) TaxID=412133 RepID=A2FGU0_TRIV3|nr:tetraspanin family [Trichomonas vaginalis G3]EAX95884.1 Tetraspanin family protein [Trichomonas vaginalis G3]KAI5528789.1 tetraspanin family [Trichomonas vaginalis G3]|eukprot:XP_001308814.1 Tetraspanin family protein [Trichomonas vaginalis G3]